MIKTQQQKFHLQNVVGLWVYSGNTQGHCEIYTEREREIVHSCQIQVITGNLSEAKESDNFQIYLYIQNVKLNTYLY